MKKIFRNIVSFVKNNPYEIILVEILLLAAGILHGYNMLYFPYYENDEGTYVSQAWSFISDGNLSPYTYWYDHAPLGSMFIGIWTKLVGGFFTFGTAVDTGRWFMLILHLFSVLLVYSIGKRLTKKIMPGFFAGLFFSVAPLALYFGRRVLLDNIMIFWFLLSLWFLLAPKLKLRNVVLSAIAFAAAVLTKETAIFLLPAFLLALWTNLQSSTKTFGRVLWISIAGLCISIYPVYALLKSEFFPDSWFGTRPHVSLLETLFSQSSRGENLPFWKPDSDFYINAVEWFARDPILVSAGLASIIISILIAYKIKQIRIPLAASLGLLLFLMRGGLVINFYILPLIPFISLLVGILLESLVGWFSRAFVRIGWSKNTRIMYAGGSIVMVWAISLSIISKPSGLFTVDETTPMRNTIAWVKQNLNPASTLIIDNAIFVDLREARFPGDPEFANAEWFWKVEKDDTVYEKNIGGDWHNIDYVLLSHEMVRQAGDYQITRIKEILPQAKLVAGWADGGAYIDLQDYISTNGDWMYVYKLVKPLKIR